MELITGATASLMKLNLYNSEDRLVCELTEDSATLDSAGVQNGWRIDVVDPSKHKGEFEDLAQVKKYEMSSEDYAKRTGRSSSHEYYFQKCSKVFLGSSNYISPFITFHPSTTAI